MPCHRALPVVAPPGPGGRIKLSAAFNTLQPLRTDLHPAPRKEEFAFDSFSLLCPGSAERGRDVLSADVPVAPDEVEALVGGS